MYRIEKNDWKSNNKKIKISESLRKMKMHVGYKKTVKTLSAYYFNLQITTFSLNFSLVCNNFFSICCRVCGINTSLRKWYKYIITEIPFWNVC